MGALSNSGRKTANFAGFYKGIQSAGAAISWRIDAMDYSYATQFAITWALLAGSLVIASPVIFMKIKDATDIDDDLVDTDLNYADVMPQALIIDKNDQFLRQGYQNNSAYPRHAYNSNMDDIELPQLRHEKTSDEIV